MVTINTITPANYSTGITDCTINYKAKSSHPGKAKVNIIMSGSNRIWFFENGRETKNLDEFEITQTNDYVIFETGTHIKARQTDRPEAAIIEIRITDTLGNNYFDTKGITHE